MSNLGLATIMEKLKDPLERGKYSPVLNVTDLSLHLENLYHHGIQRGVKTGWSTLDEWYTVRKGEWTLITGYPNHGKSCWLDNLLVNLANRENWHIAIFSAENMPVERHIASLIEIYLGQPFTKGPTPRMTLSEMKAGEAWLNAHFTFINPNLDDRRLENILEWGELLCRAKGVDAFVLDPWNELDHARPANLREDEHISISLSQIRDFSRRHKVHFFVVAHPRIPRKEPGASYPVPTLYDVKGASEWNAKADNGISVWRDLSDPEHGTDIHVQKVRFREVGKAGGGCNLKYDIVTGRFTDPHQRINIDDYLKRQAEPLKLQREPGAGFEEDL